MERTEIDMTPIKTQREIWVDQVKAIGCILVVLGHFFQSMTQARILPANDLYQWFEQTIYCFHVPLFFICSGYLYQKRSSIHDIAGWGRMALKKLLVLGVPYFTFSSATWILKTLFSSSVNRKIGGLVDTLFFHPAAPYWYLYTLFFLFLITPTLRNGTMALAELAAALLLKVLGALWGVGEVQPIGYIVLNEIWFVIGMCLCASGADKRIRNGSLRVPVITGVLFLLLSIRVYRMGIDHELVNFLLGLMACFSVVAFMARIFANRANGANGRQPVLLGVLARYTMPVYLMHTIFAASARILLLQLGISSAAVHLPVGIAIGFAGPVIAAVVMKKSGWLAFFLSPAEFVRIQ